jgi:hypothetical protein
VGGVKGAKSREGRCSFLKKRTKRLLSIGGGMRLVPADKLRGARAKVFWFFSSEKNAFLEPMFSSYL